MEIIWGFCTSERKLVFTARTEMDGKPYSYSKGFPVARLRFAVDREGAVQAMARETAREMQVDLAALRATFEARGSDRKLGGGSYHE